MNILVVEDNQKHIDSAKVTLADHRVAIVRSFTEAMALLKLRHDKNLEKSLRDEYMAAGYSYNEADMRARFQCGVPTKAFDVVLTDMLLTPLEQVPYGLIIALQAARNGARFVAMVSDQYHHNRTMLRALDNLGLYVKGVKPNFEINGARVMFCYSPFYGDYQKDWGAVLQDLTQS